MFYGIYQLFFGNKHFFVGAKFVENQFRGHSGYGLFACGIDIEEYDAYVGEVERRCKFIGEVACTRVQVRLEGYGKLALGIQRLDGCDALTQLVGMMRVVVDDDVLRLGGDEFAVFIPGMLDKERAEAFFDRLFSNIEHIDIAEMNGKHILLSLGACFYDGMDRITFDQLYRRADTAMYDSKKKQGYSATIFDAKQ